MYFGSPLSSCHSDSVCPCLKYCCVPGFSLFAMPCWILFADRRPTLALGLIFVLPVLYLCCCLTLAVILPCLGNKANQTHLNQLIIVFKTTRRLQAGEYYQGWIKSLQESGLEGPSLPITGLGPTPIKLT